MLHELLDGVFIVLILLVLGLLLSIKQWPEWFRRARSTHWPVALGTIEGGEVSTIRGRSGRTYRATETATAKLGYSYQLNGTYYSGYYTATFNDEQTAWSYVDSLKGQAVQVSYNPRSPAVSVLRRQRLLG